MSNFICSICHDFLLEPVEVAPEDENNYQQVLTFCGHIFHNCCISNWLDSRRDLRANLSCPMCFKIIHPRDIVKIHPSSGGPFVDYLTLLAQVKIQTDNLNVLCLELGTVYSNSRQVKQERKERDEKLEELKKTLADLEKIGEEKFGSDFKNRQLMKTENKGLNIKLEEYKIGIKEKQKPNHASRAAVEAIKLLFEMDYSTTDPGGANSHEPHCSFNVNSGDRIASAQEVVDKIKQILMIRRESLKIAQKKVSLPPTTTVTKQPLENTVKKAELPVPQIFIPSAIIGSLLNSFQEVIMQEHLNALGFGTTFFNESMLDIIVYLPRSKIFFPSLELFQLQMSTFLRISKIPHKLEVIKNDNSKEPIPVLKIGNRKIYELEICSELIKKLFCSNSEQKALRRYVSKRSKIYDIFGVKILWGILYWQWSFDNGNYMKKINANRDTVQKSQIAAEIKIKVERMAKNQAFGLMKAEQILGVVINDIKTASEELGSKDYFSGSSPGEIDCCAFVLLTQILWNTQESGYKTELLRHKNLINFIVRMRHQYWREWTAASAFPSVWMV